ncbi:MAG: mechanosensitive ion channel [Clostridiales bacterium]|nr:mechanosensitive ion channel [Clostridiales bacterium]
MRKAFTGGRKRNAEIKRKRTAHTNAMQLQHIICTSGALAQAEKYGWRIVITLAVLIIGIVSIRLVGFWVQRALLKSPVNGTLTGFIAAMVKCGLWLLLAFVCAAIAGIPSAPLVTVLGSAGLALSLALKDSLSNLAGGIMMLGTKPFAAGDYVDVDGTAGTVKRIRLTTSELVTPDNKTVLLPNSSVMKARITNYSMRSTRRVEFALSVAYGTDLARLRALVLHILRSSPYALPDPAPTLVFVEASDSSLDFSARIWVRRDDYWDAYWELNETLAQELMRADIVIPFRQIDVHIDGETPKQKGA